MAHGRGRPPFPKGLHPGGVCRSPCRRSIRRQMRSVSIAWVPSSLLPLLEFRCDGWVLVGEESACSGRSRIHRLPSCGAACGNGRVRNGPGQSFLGALEPTRWTDRRNPAHRIRRHRPGYEGGLFSRHGRGHEPGRSGTRPDTGRGQTSTSLPGKHEGCHGGSGWSARPPRATPVGSEFIVCLSGRCSGAYARDLIGRQRARGREPRIWTGQAGDRSGGDACHPIAPVAVDRDCPAVQCLWGPRLSHRTPEPT